MTNTPRTAMRKILLVSSDRTMAGKLIAALCAQPEGWVCEHKPFDAPGSISHDLLAILWDIRREPLIHKPSTALPMIALGVPDHTQSFFVDCIHEEDPQRQAIAISHTLRGVCFAVQHKVIAPSWAELAQSERLRSLGEIAAGVAHDINNVLAAITGRTAMIRKKLADQLPITHDLGIVESASQSASSMVQRIQHYIRPPSLSKSAWIDLNPIIRESIELIRPRIPVDVTISMHQIECPPVWANPNEIREVILNVVRNALDALGSHGQINIGATCDEHAVAIYIRDTGPGISRADQERIWDPFYSTRESGSGLGLSVSRWLAEKNGAELVIEDTAACAVSGCGFLLKFPASSSSESDVSENS